VVAYLRYADKYVGPLASCLREVYQPVIMTRNWFSRPVYTSWHISERTEPLHTLTPQAASCFAQFVRICRWLWLIYKDWLAPLENAPFSTLWARK
jgi:hypothetical protein